MKAKKKKTVRVKAWIATNPGEFDVENMSFYKTEQEARRSWANDRYKQQFIPITITYSIPRRKRP